MLDGILLVNSLRDSDMIEMLRPVAIVSTTKLGSANEKKGGVKSLAERTR